jgi:DNA-binding CsgD family transcriptional regulator
MATRSGIPGSRRQRAPTDSVGSSAPGKTGRAQGNGGRAVPGKVPRGSLHRAPAGTKFTPLARAILDKLDRGIVLLDGQGRVVDSNAIAHRVLASGNGLMVRNDRLAFADGEIDGRFEQLLKSNGKPRGKTDGKSEGKTNGKARVVAATVKRPGATSCRVLVTPVATPDGEAQHGAFLAVIYAPAEQRDIANEVLLEIYGLTRAQADVARQLYAGLSVEETATQLQLSLNTVRTHLKHIFSKCEVQSQAELMHALALGPQHF